MSKQKKPLKQPQKKQNEGPPAVVGGPSTNAVTQQYDPILAAIVGVEKSVAIAKESKVLSHSGPLPPPSMLEEYRKLIPDAPERLLALVEREQSMRHENEQYLIHSATQDAIAGRRAHLRGDIISCLIFLVCSAMGLAILFSGYSQIIAASLLGAPLLGALASFLLYRKDKGR